MAQTAAWWTDKVLPDVPMRQWVLSVPFKVRYLTAFDAQLCTEVLQTFLNTLFSWQRLRARRMAIQEGKTGAVTVIQRFGSALNLNVHYHSLAFDGVWVVGDEEQGGEPASFQRLPEPTDGEVAQLVTAIRRRVMRRLGRLGVVESLGQDQYGPDPLRLDEPLMADCYGASILGRIATGPRAGQPVERFGGLRGLPWAEVRSKQCAQIDGFSLHANTGIPSGDRDRLERVVRYIARPAVANDRLEMNEEGKVVVRLKTMWSDGTQEVRFTPGEFIEKLAALVPTPRANLVRYHGVFAPNSPFRHAVVPPATSDFLSREADRSNDVAPSNGSRETIGQSQGDSGRRRKSGASGFTWAELMLRVFAIDVLACSDCGGRMKIISVILDPQVVVPFLKSIGLPPYPPPISPARAPPEPVWI